MKILFDQQSAFSRIIVEEDEQGVRTLKFGESVQSRENPSLSVSDNWHNRLHYLKVAPRLIESMISWPDGRNSNAWPRRILCIGLGAGTFPKAMHSLYPKAEIVTIEIDRMVIEVAKHFFNHFAYGPILECDARKFLALPIAAPFDLIFVDAFGQESPARRLQTLEAVRLLQDHLAPNGVAMANVYGPNTDKLYPQVERAWQETFLEFESVKCHSDPFVSDNRIFVGRGVPNALKDGDLQPHVRCPCGWCAGEIQDRPNCYALRGNGQAR